MRLDKFTFSNFSIQKLNALRLFKEFEMSGNACHQRLQLSKVDMLESNLHFSYNKLYVMVDIVINTTVTI